VSPSSAGHTVLHEREVHALPFLRLAPSPSGPSWSSARCSARSRSSRWRCTRPSSWCSDSLPPHAFRSRTVPSD
jgi:hypothetical protein